MPASLKEARVPLFRRRHGAVEGKALAAATAVAIAMVAFRGG